MQIVLLTVADGNKLHTVHVNIRHSNNYSEENILQVGRLYLNVHFCKK